MWKKILALALAALLWAAASAEPLALPEGIEAIEASAFEGCAAIDAVVIPEGCAAIGEAAFRGCASLKRVALAGTVEAIADDSFDGCGEALYFTCPAGSAAAAWARGSGFDYSAGTVCRALVIGQRYTGTSRVLYGTVNDAVSVEGCLKALGTTAYRVTRVTNLTAEGILSAIEDTFGAAGEDDISLLYYSGHGEAGGELVGSDLAYLSPAQLRACLDGIPGRKVIIVDACYSGALVADEDALEADEAWLSAAEIEEPAAPEPEAFVQSFLSAFALRKRSAFGGAGRYYVITSAHADQTSGESSITSGGASRVMGFFTYALCAGCGWDGVTRSACEAAADLDGDGAVTLAEAFEYANGRAAFFNPDQAAVAYPEGCTAFAPFRR